MMVEIGSSPRVTSSRKRIMYRRSSWSVHEFEVRSDGGAVYRMAALRAAGSLLVWLGAGEPPALALGGAALAVPGAGATALLAGPAPDCAVPLARRLAARLARPVYVCCGAGFDRFTLPLVERALIHEIQNRPECFT